ncbi:MAG TPA: L,D-transpeptidase [Longimicrobium sp.]|nr:L,D-transpeptidase [Longimicrobium sp.]
MTTLRSSNLARAAATLAVAGALLLAAGDAHAQARRRATEPSATRAPAATTSQGLRVRSESLARGGYAVVVDLDANRLYFAKGRRVLWSAPVGTGTGLRLDSGHGNWDFNTPNGTFHVTYKEIEPDWIAPDWYFVENGLSVPGPEDQKRHFPRGLGSAAVYIGRGLAIHGTDKPELLGQRVSHGCIRLSNADALRLFHNVQVGTEVVMVGGRGQAPSRPPVPSQPTRSRVNSRGERIPPPRDPFIVELEEESTESLLARLDEELFSSAFASGSSQWHQVASVLLLRGAKQDDDEALGGLLSRYGELGSGALRDEYATFMADAYAQGTLRTLEVMSRLDRTTRARVASGIVNAALALYPGDVESASTPWPTRRAPRDVLARGGQRGWDALKLAEDTYREESGMAFGGTGR